MDYTEVRFYNDATLNEVIIAWLGENDFEMFEERNDGLNAYIDSENFNEDNLRSALSNIPGSEENIRYETMFIKDQNWNKKWESNFEPVLIAGRVFIRAPFHEARKDSEYEIVIEPKMSFGTGHHPTTSLMIELMLGSDFKKKKVLDMGSGTGILAIFAEKLGAREIVAIDIEDWAYENCVENCQRNNSKNISILKGDIKKADKMKFDVLLANINRNILLTDIPGYSELLIDGGELFLSGILAEDKEIINSRAEAFGLRLIKQSIQDNWLALRYKKIENEN